MSLETDSPIRLIEPDRIRLYVHTWAGFVYVAFVIDAYARRIVGWKVSSSATAGFVLDTLEQAIHARRPGPDDGLIHHRGRGVQYRAMTYTPRLAEASLVPSVGRVGDSYDTALAETDQWPLQGRTYLAPAALAKRIGAGHGHAGRALARAVSAGRVDSRPSKVVPQGYKSKIELLAIAPI